MKRLHLLLNLAIIVALALSMVLVACSKSAAEVKKEQLTYYKLQASSTGGGYYVYGIALSKILADNTNLRLLVSSGYTLENTILLRDKKTDIAGIAAAGLAETFGDINAIKAGPVRILTPGVPTPFVFVVRNNNPAKTFADLKGQRLAMGTEANESYLVGSAFMDAMGLKAEEYFKRVFMKTDTAAEALNEGTIDVWAFNQAEGSAIHKQMGTIPGGIRFIQAPVDAITKFTSDPKYGKFGMQMKQYAANTIIEGTGPITAPVGTNPFGVNKDFPEADAYTIIKMIDVNRANLIKMWSTMKYCTMEDLAKSPFPLHAGVEKYLKEKGLR